MPSSELRKTSPRERYKARRDALTDALYAPFRGRARLASPQSLSASLRGQVSAIGKIRIREGVS